MVKVNVKLTLNFQISCWYNW